MNIRSFISLLACVLPAASLAASFDLGPVFTVLEENDLVFDTDRHYTQGIKVSLLGADNQVPRVVENGLDLVPSPGYDVRATRWGLALGQNIYTPANTRAKRLLDWDRPYAGWLYAGAVLQRRGLAADRWVTLESFELNLGVIGPESLAEQAQTWVHETRGFELPQGWDNQLDTEPGLHLKYLRAIRLAPLVMEQHLDFIPHAGFALGNVETSLRCGGMVRLGFNLPDDFGIQSIGSLLTPEGGHSRNESSKWGVHVFTGIEGWLIGHSAFFDGNLYQSSHQVNREWFVAEARFGVVFDLKRFQLAFTHVARSPEFEGQAERNDYGSVSIKVEF